MIGRIMLSLKKAADPQRTDWNLTEAPPNFTTRPTIIFYRSQNPTDGTRDVVADEACLTEP